MNWCQSRRCRARVRPLRAGSCRVLGWIHGVSAFLEVLLNGQTKQARLGEYGQGFSPGHGKGRTGKAGSLYAPSGSSSRHTALELQPRHNMLAAAAAAARLPSTPPKSHRARLKIVMQAGSFSLSPSLPLPTCHASSGQVCRHLSGLRSRRVNLSRRLIRHLPGVVPNSPSPKHVLLSTFLSHALSLSLLITQSAVPRFGGGGGGGCLNARERPLSVVGGSDALAGRSCCEEEAEVQLGSSISGLF